MKKTIIIFLLPCILLILGLGCSNKEENIFLVEPIRFYVETVSEEDSMFVEPLDGYGGLMVAKEPAMIVTNVCGISQRWCAFTDVANEEGDKEKSPFLDLEFTKKDTVRFAKLTKNNTRRRILFRWGEHNLVAPMVMVPILKGRLSCPVSPGTAAIVSNHLLRVSESLHRERTESAD